MDKQTGVAIVASKVGNRSDLDAQIARSMQLRQEAMEDGDFSPWFLLSEDNYSTTTAAEDRIPLPTDFRREFEEGALWYYDATLAKPWKALDKIDEEDRRNALGDLLDATGSPSHYSITASYFRLAPVPDAAYTLYMKYYRKDVDVTTLSSTGTNLWLTYGSDVLIAETCVDMIPDVQLRNKIVVQELNNALLRAKTRILVANQARLTANRRLVMGS